MIGSYSSKSRLESALKESRRYGRDGHLEAEKSIKLLRNVIKKSVEELDKDISKSDKYSKHWWKYWGNTSFRRKQENRSRSFKERESSL